MAPSLAILKNPIVPSWASMVSGFEKKGLFGLGAAFPVCRYFCETNTVKITKQATVKK
jgi:hypothetical protein